MDIKHLILFGLLPLLTFACQEWPISREKTLHICGDKYVMVVAGATGKTMYMVNEAEFRTLACFANRLKLKMKVGGVPTFTTTEVREMCDYFKRQFLTSGGNATR